MKPSILATIVSAVALTLAAAGCSGQPAPAPVPAGQPAAPKVAKLVMGVTPPAQESNNSNKTGGPNGFQLRPMYEYLVGVDPATGKYVPQLATEWSIEPDGMGFRLKLRPDVAYHQGKGKLTAKDVQFGLADLTAADSTHGSVNEFKQSVDRIEAVSELEVVFRLKQANPNVFNVVSEQVAGFEMMSTADLEQRGGAPPTLADTPLAGTGPYQFKERTQGQFVRFERAPGKHWRSEVDFTEFEFRWMKEASTRLAALLAGEVHLTDLPSDLKKQAVQQGMKSIVSKLPGLRTFYSFYGAGLKNPRNPEEGYAFPNNPLLDVRVRKALSKALDKDALNKAFFLGEAKTMIINTFDPTRPGWNAEWERRFKDEYGYDPEAARRLLADAGYTAARPLETSIFSDNLPTYSGSADLVEATADAWRKVGVKVNLLSSDPATITAKLRANEFDNHVRIIGTSADMFIGNRTYATSIQGSGGGAGALHDAELDRLYQRVTSTLDPTQQEQLFRAFGDRMYNLHQNIPLFWLPTDVLVNPNAVADWLWPGSISGTWTHFENLKAARS